MHFETLIVRKVSIPNRDLMNLELPTIQWHGNVASAGFQSLIGI